MEDFKLDENIRLLCIRAASFPGGIRAAQEKLSAIPETGSSRNHFGVSYLYDDEILYLAGVAVQGVNENIPAGCESYTLNKGNYISIYIPDFAKDTTQIEKAFKKLLADRRIVENECCAEWYLPEGSDFSNAKDVRCMVRLAD